MPIYAYAETAALLVSVFCFKKLKGTLFGGFPYFLALTVLVEFAGPLYSHQFHKSNVWIYNLFTPLEICFYSWIFNCAYRKGINRAFARWFIPFYISAVAINELFIQGFNVFHSYTMALGDLFIVIFCCLYFYEMLQDEAKLSLLKDPMFWYATGLLFFYLGDFFYELYWDIIMQNRLDEKRFIFETINNNLNVVLYLCFSVSFICMKKNS